MTVTGTTTPGATVDVEAVGSAGGVAATATTKADSSGNWSLPIATSFGNTTITVTATKGDSTGYAQDNVNYFVLPGTQVFSTSPIPSATTTGRDVPVPDRDAISSRERST